MLVIVRQLAPASQAPLTAGEMRSTLGLDACMNSTHRGPLLAESCVLRSDTPRAIRLSALAAPGFIARSTQAARGGADRSRQGTLSAAAVRTWHDLPADRAESFHRSYEQRTPRVTSGTRRGTDEPR